MAEDALSERTLAEMQAGANAVAAHQGRDPVLLNPDQLDSMRSIVSRSVTLRAWENAGKITVEFVKRLSVPYDERPEHQFRRLYRVKNGPTFDDYDAEMAGTSPSELLIAQMALALRAQGEI